MKNDRPKPFLFSKRFAQRPFWPRAEGHGGCGFGEQPQLADGPSMSERRLREGGQRVLRKSNECRLDKLFFSAGQSSALFVANCRGGPSQSELFGGIVAAAKGLSRTGLTGTR